MRKYILMIMSIGFMFAVLAVGTQPSYVYAAVTEYNLCVGGTWVTSGNAENIPQAAGSQTTGKASYNAETNTLTLEDYKCTGVRTGPPETECYIFGVIDYRGNDQLNIEVKGTNELKAVELEYNSNSIWHVLRSAIYSEKGSFSFTGDGELAVYGPNNEHQSHADGMQLWYGDIIIDGPTIYTQAGDTKSSGSGISANYVTVKSGSVTAKGAPKEEARSIGIEAENEIRIEKGVTRVEASGMRNAVSGRDRNTNKTVNLIPGKYWNDPEGTQGEGEIIDVNEEGGDLTWVGKKIVFEEVRYPLYVGGKAISTRNEDDVFGNGKVSFVPASGDVPATLTLNNFKFSTQIISFFGIYDGVISYLGEDTLILEIKGTNVLKGNGVNHGIFFNGTLIIKGDGSLSVIGYDDNSVISYNTNGAHGIFGNSKTADLLIESGTIKASGGRSADPSQKNNGIKVRSVTINGGTLTATGSNFGIDGDVTVGKDMSRVEITGTSGAISQDHILKNDASGKGWSDTGGTEGEERIEINKEGSSYSYKRILFNKPAIIVDMPVASESVYDGTSQPLLSDTGTASGGTLCYALGDKNGPTEQFTGSIPKAKDAGTYYVWCQVAADADHSDLEPICVTVDIPKAKITITADSKSSESGKDPAELTYTLNGAYVEGDDLGIALSTDADLSTPGTYPITVSWNGNPSYEATLVNGEYQVTEKVDPIIPPDDTPVDPDVPVVNTAKISTKGNFTKKLMQIRFPADESVTNYRIQYRMAGKKAWKSGWSAGTNTYIIKGLKRSSLCEFRIAGYVKQTDGTWIRGNWSKVSYRYMSVVPLKTIKADKKKITVTWTKDRKASGYQIQYSMKKNMAGARTITVGGASKTKCTIKGLKSGKRYYVKIRPVKAKANKKYLGILTKAKAAKVK